VGLLLDQRTQLCGGDDAAIQQDEHARLHRAGEHQESEPLLGDPTRSEHGIDDGMGAHLCQVQAAHLRKGTLVLAEASATKIERIGRGISDLI
jgi:hypothetical protein